MQLSDKTANKFDHSAENTCCYDIMMLSSELLWLDQRTFDQAKDAIDFHRAFCYSDERSLHIIWKSRIQASDERIAERRYRDETGKINQGNTGK